MDSSLTAQNPIAIPKWAFYVDALSNQQGGQMSGESICIDCGVDTCPCTGKRGCRHTGRWEHYMVHDRVWKAARMGGDDGYLCIGCLETRIGRKLRPRDFTTAPCNDPDDPWSTPRLANRQRLPPLQKQLRRCAGTWSFDEKIIAINPLTSQRAFKRWSYSLSDGELDELASELKRYAQNKKRKGS